MVEGTDIMVIRELTGGLYFGEPRGREEFADGGARAVNTMAYTSREIERVARAALRRGDEAQEAPGLGGQGQRAGRLAALAGGRDAGRRRTIPQVKLEHVLVDNCAMALVHKPTHFDTIVTENTFGDILSDEAAILAGSMGMLPSASLGGQGRASTSPCTAPRPTSRARGWPTRSRRSCRRPCCCATRSNRGADADRVDAAVLRVLEQGHRTRDIHSAGTKLVGTRGDGRPDRRREVEKSY